MDQERWPKCSNCQWWQRTPETPHHGFCCHDPRSEEIPERPKNKTYTDERCEFHQFWQLEGNQ